jgi:hypothetical protein
MFSIVGDRNMSILVLGFQFLVLKDANTNFWPCGIETNRGSFFGMKKPKVEIGHGKF